MQKITDKKQVAMFIGLCWIVYFTSYITRINYGAALAEVVNAMQVTKAAAGLASTCAFITYGAGQLVSGYFGDKFKPKNIIFFGLLLTATCNVLMPLCGNINIMTAIWAVNGFAQSMMWPPLVRIMSDSLTDDGYRKASLQVTIASSSGTIAVYLIVPACIEISSWKTVFFFCAFCAVAVSVAWFAIMKNFEKITGVIGGKSKKKTQYKNAESAPKEPLAKAALASGLIPIVLAIFLQGTLRDGVTTWLPNMVSEVFELGTSVSILSAVVLPILSIFSVSVASAIRDRVDSEVKCSLILFIIAFICAAMLAIFFDLNAFLSVALMAVITACMHGINLMLVCHVPARFAKFGKVSTVSGILNSFTYVGSAVSTYGIAVLSEKFGWGFTTVIWGVVCVLGALSCLAASKKWKIFINE